MKLHTVLDIVISSLHYILVSENYQRKTVAMRKRHTSVVTIAIYFGNQECHRGSSLFTRTTDAGRRLLQITRDGKTK